MILTFYILGYKTDSIMSIFKLSYVDKNTIYYEGKLLSEYDDNCSVVVKNTFTNIRLYCDSHRGRQLLFREWERGIVYQPVYDRGVGK